MNHQELEDLYIRSLDIPMNNAEKEKFLGEMRQHPDLAKQLAMHNKIRDVIRSRETATFGPNFASRLVLKILNSGIVIDRQIFSFFKRFQLAALGIVVALLILNAWLAEESSLKSILGFERTVEQEDEIMSFDFSEILNKDL
ncbi:MAG TPA: hypothetical protein VFW11_03545 [Cyclobacteriaceae bacterium]|nr:hypothetical protein [Cyclobacteriaceae bacterium]